MSINRASKFRAAYWAHGPHQDCAPKEVQNLKFSVEDFYILESPDSDCGCNHMISITFFIQA